MSAQGIIEFLIQYGRIASIYRGAKTKRVVVIYDAYDDNEVRGEGTTLVAALCEIVRKLRTDALKEHAATSKYIEALTELTK